MDISPIIYFYNLFARSLRMFSSELEPVAWIVCLEYF